MHPPYKLLNNYNTNWILRLGGSTIFWKEFKSYDILYVSLKAQTNLHKIFGRVKYCCYLLIVDKYQTLAL